MRPESSTFRASVHGRLLFSFGIGHFVQILVDDVIELSLQHRKEDFLQRTKGE